MHEARAQGDKSMTSQTRHPQSLRKDAQKKSRW